MWCVAELDAEYITKMEDVLVVYEKPDDLKEPVVGLDEQPVSLHADVRPPRAARPGPVAKRDNAYRRCGTANIFGIVEPKADRHFTCATPNRSVAQVVEMIRTIVMAYPRTRSNSLGMDNLNIHCEHSLTTHVGRRTGRCRWRRLTVHDTPKPGTRRTTINWRVTRKDARRRFGDNTNLSKRSET